MSSPPKARNFDGRVGRPRCARFAEPSNHSRSHLPSSPFTIPPFSLLLAPKLRGDISRFWNYFQNEREHQDYREGVFKTNEEDLQCERDNWGSTLLN